MRLAWPGKYDDADPADLAAVVLEVYPQLGDKIDPVTAGTELLPASDGGPRRSADFLKTAQGQWIPKPPPAPATSVPMTEEVRRHIERRPATLGDQLITGGIRVAGGIAAPAVAATTAAGGAVAVPFTGGASIPVTLAAPAMGIATGAAFEALAQGYEQAAGISEEISPLNVIGQGALNMVPVAPALKRGATVLSAVTAGAAPKVSSALAKAGASSGLASRLIGNTIEGAVASTTGSGLETMTEQGRIPTLPELGTAAGIGGVFGAGFGGAIEGGSALVSRARLARGQKMTAAVHGAMDAAEQASGGILPPEGQEALRLEVVKVLQQAERLDPVGTKGAATRLMGMLENSRQAGLQARAAAFLQAFAEQSPSMAPQQRLDIAHQFLVKIKDEGLTPDALDSVVRTLAGIDTAGRVSDAAAPGQKFLPAPKSAPGLVVGADGIERVADVPYDPDFQPQQGLAGVDPVQAGPPQYSGPTVPFVVDGEGGARRAGSVYEGTQAATPPQLPRYEYDSTTGRIVELPTTTAARSIEAETLAADRSSRYPRAIGRLRDVTADTPAGPRPGEPGGPPPEVDWRGAKSQEELAAEIAAERAAIPGRMAAATTPELPNIPEAPAGVKRVPRSQRPKPPYMTRGEREIVEARAAGAPPPPPKTGVHLLAPVKEGILHPEDAALLRLVQADVREFPFEQAMGRTDLMKQDDRADGRNEFEKNRATQRVPGTFVARTIAKMAGFANVDEMNRRELVEQINAFLNGTRTGKAKEAGKLAAAAVRYTTLLRKAWDGERFSKARLGAVDLRTAGISFRDLHFPNLTPRMVLALDEADDILERFAPEMLAEREALKAEGAPVAAKEAAEAQTRVAPPGQGAEFLAGLTNAQVRDLHAELQRLGPDAAPHRQWVTQAMEDRGLAQPTQAVLGPAPDRLLPMLPETPSPRVLQLDEALMTPEGVDATADALNVRAAAQDDLAAMEREGPAVPDDPMPEGFGELPDGGDAPSSSGPSFFDETGAVGNIARARAARAKKLKEMAGTAGAPANLRMDQSTYTQLESAIRKAGDTEAAGLLLGSADGQIQRVILSRNIAADPTRTFQIAPETIAAAQAKAKELGLELLGSFHSQPGGSSTPSRADLRGGVADLPMLIVGTRQGQIRDVGVWQPQGKARFMEGSISLADAPPRQGLPAKVRPIKAAIKKIPTFRGAMGDAPAIERYLADFADELGNEPFFQKAQAALEAGDARKAWLEVQIGQVAYGNVTKEAIGRLEVEQAGPLRDRIAALEARSAQSGVGQLWALYNGRTVYVEGVGRIVVTPELPPALADTGVTAGPGGVLRPPTPTAALPDAATRTRMSLAVVNQVLKDIDPDLIVDDPTKVSATRLFRQTAEQMMLAPHQFAAMKALGVSPEQAAGHFEGVVTESARILASLSAWKRAHKQAIQRIEGISGADGSITDLQVIGKGRKVGRLSELTPNRTFDELLSPKNSWEKVILLQTLTPDQIGTFDQLGRASRGFMLAQWATALRNVYSATARWGADGAVSTLQGMAYVMSGEGKKAAASFAKTGDLIRYAPIIRPDTWVMPWNARQAEWEKIFQDGGTIFSAMPEDRRAVLNALLSVPEKAAHFLGGTNFGEELRQGKSGSAILDYLATPKVQNTLTMFNRAQEFTIRSAMLQVSLNHQLRLRGLNPAKALQLPPDALRKLLGEDGFTQVFDRAVGESLDFTFAGDLIRRGFGRSAEGTHQAKGGVNTQIIDLINKIPVIREGYPFGKFNLSAAPRYLWDHSGIGLFIDPLYSAIGKRGRYHLGKTGKTFRDVLIPEANQKIAAARGNMQEALTAWQGIKSEITARKRLAAQHRRLTVEQANLPEIASRIEANRAALDALETAATTHLERYEDADSVLKGLEAQKRTLQETVAQAAAANAPEDFQTLFARNMAGAAVMLPLAMMLRADQRDKGTPWYKYKLPNSDVQLDLRPMAPFVQYLFVADVLQDFHDYTDWGGVLEDLESGKYEYDELGSRILVNGRYEGKYGGEVGMMAVAHALLSSNLQGILDTPSSVYAHYEGKYTSASLGRELAQVAVSTSQIAGTTLSLVDAVLDISEQGLPSPKKVVNLVANTLGQMLARYFIPMGQFKSVSDLYDDQESLARIADTGEDYSLTGLAQGLGNLPFIGAATIPETYNQLTGKPLDTYMPLLRSVGGVTAQKWNRVVGEIADIGLPGPSVYIRSTGDKYLDTLIGYHYARLVQQYVPSVLDSEEYQQRESPALRRDFLSPRLAKLKKSAIALAGMDAGADRIKVAREGTEAGRRKQREARLRQLLLEEQLTGVETASDAADEMDAAGLPDLREEPEMQEPELPQ